LGFGVRVRRPGKGCSHGVPSEFTDANETPFAISPGKVMPAAPIR
jgi:hypothetical protein